MSEPRIIAVEPRDELRVFTRCEIDADKLLRLIIEMPMKIRHEDRGVRQSETPTVWWILNRGEPAGIIEVDPADYKVRDGNGPETGPGERRGGLTGIIPIRNGNSLDYAWQLAVESLLPICDEVIISDGESSDGTYEEAVAWTTREPKLRLLTWPWPHPRGDVWFLTKWLHFTQRYARFDMGICLDADEVLDERAYPVIRRSVQTRTALWAWRHNLWGDPAHCAPLGKVCGEKVVRLSPMEHEMVSDNIYPNGIEPTVKQIARHDPSFVIWHLGFMRKPQSFCRKARAELHYLLNSMDDRIVRAEQTGENWQALSSGWPEPLIEHGQEMPEKVKNWLRERNWEC